MSREPLVSFVLPCFNYGKYLPECLHSIFEQRGCDDMEVIAIDDCSTDDTWQILNDWRDSRLSLQRHERNRGHLVTVNEGLAAARGKFVARLDPDDRLRPNFLATLLPQFGNSKVGFAYGDAAIIDAAGAVTLERCPQPHGGRPFAGWALLDILAKNYICAPAAMARREAWQQHLPIWDGLAFNDFYFNVLIAREWDFAYAPEVVADYRVHGSNHHSRIVLNKTEEASLLRVVDWAYGRPEADPARERLKQGAKARIYAGWYLDQAEKYFGVNYDEDALRCYREAFRRQPGRFLQPGPLRRSLGLLLGRARYERIKNRLKSAAGKPAPAAPAESPARTLTS